jgi:hypothetical protein
LSRGGLATVADDDSGLRDYLSKMANVEPDTLSRDEALAFWINLYNAGAIQLATEAFLAGADSVLRTPGGFSAPIATISGEALSLDAIEHGKIRRFGDPRVHGALVCGSLSCPTVRSLPYTGADLDRELDDQMRSFLLRGGAIDGGDGVVRLSRVLLWFGSDFARPARMPTFLPVSKRRTLEVIGEWLPPELADSMRVEFQSYDWSLGCQVR